MPEKFSLYQNLTVDENYATSYNSHADSGNADRSLVMTLDVKNVGMAVVDNDRTELSRRMTADMYASEYLSVTDCYSNYSEVFRQIDNGKADAIVTIPNDYQKNLTNGKRTELDLKAKGVNATKGTLGAQYATMSVAKTVLR